MIMKTHESRDCRAIFHIRIPVTGLLPGLRKIHFFSKLSLLFMGAAIPAVSCTPDILVREAGGDGETAEKADSVCFRFRTKSAGKIRRLDLFVYEDADDGRLVSHYIGDGSEEDIELRLPEGGKRAVAVANSPRNFNDKALEKYSSIKQIAYSFEDDDIEYPVMGAVAQCHGYAELTLSSLFCTVAIKSISNTMDDYELFEEPTAMLRNINARAELFGKRKYFPTELTDGKDRQEFPYDIGMYPQYPDIMLYCYPNDTMGGLAGPDMTSIELQGMIKGSRRSFEFFIPGISRGETVYADITVNSEYDAQCRFSRDAPAMEPGAQEPAP